MRIRGGKTRQIPLAQEKRLLKDQSITACKPHRVRGTCRRDRGLWGVWIWQYLTMQSPCKAHLATGTPSFHTHSFPLLIRTTEDSSLCLSPLPHKLPTPEPTLFLFKLKMYRHNFSHLTQEFIGSSKPTFGTH